MDVAGSQGRLLEVFVRNFPATTHTGAPSHYHGGDLAEQVAAAKQQYHWITTYVRKSGWQFFKARAITLIASTFVEYQC